MDILCKDIEFIDWVPVSLRNIRYANASKNVTQFIQERVSWVILEELDPEDFKFSEELQARKLNELQDVLMDMVTHEVYPTIRKYVSERYPENIDSFFNEDGDSFFKNFALKIHCRVTKYEEFTQEYTGTFWDSIAHFWFSREDRSRNINVFIDEIFNNHPEIGKSEEIFLDFLFQVLLHEMLHAVSSELNMTKEEEIGTRRWLAFKKTIFWEEPVRWEEMVSSSGYSFNFANDEMEDISWMPFRTYPVLNSYNEAITDILAARIYAEYTKEKYGKARRYQMKYPEEAHNFHTALREYSKEEGLDSNAVFEEIESWYFFPSISQDYGLYERVFPMLQYYDAGESFRSEISSESLLVV